MVVSEKSSIWQLFGNFCFLFGGLTCSENQFIRLGCGFWFPGFEQMSISVDGGFYGSMSHLPLDVVNILPLFQFE